MFNVIKRPLMSEKSSAYAEVDTYVFEVDRKADKTEIKKAIEKAFDVQVKDIRTANYRTKWLKPMARFGPPKYKKKAYVKLAAGQKIAMFEGA